MGLLDFIQTPEGQGLLSAVGSYAANARRGTPINNIGRGVMGGVMGYQSAQENAMVDEMKRAQLEQYKQAQAAKVAQQQALASAPEEVRNAVTMGVPIAEVWKRQNPEAKWVDGFDAQGRPVKGTFDGKGFTPVGGSQAKPLEWKDTGAELIALDPYTGMPTDQRFSKSVSPDAKFSGGITMRGQNMTDARAREAQTAPSFHDGAWVYKPTAANPTGASVEIPGAKKAGNPTEGERKAATLLQRMEGSLSQLNEVVESNPNAAKPSIVGNMIEGLPIVGDTLGNLATRSDRQRVEAAQLDILDAALTLGTGAAYTREQLEGYRKSYFPQPGDSDATVKDKQTRLSNVISAGRIAAGRALPAGGSFGTGDLSAAAAAELKRRGIQ